MDKIREHKWMHGTIRTPKLMHHKQTIKHVNTKKAPFFHKYFEAVCTDKNIHVVLDDISENVKHFKCVYSLMNVKFDCVLEYKEEEKKLIFKYELRKGESIEFQKLAKKLDKMFEKIFKGDKVMKKEEESL